MTAAAPHPHLHRLARAPRLRPAEPPADGGDRNFVTLLALNFMLLAFFVVLGTASSFDQPRVESIARNVRIIFAAPDAKSGPTAIHLSAREALAAGVSDAFAGVLPVVDRTTREDGDRVDVAMTPDVVAATSAQAMDDLLDSIATLMRGAPVGVHFELMLEGGADVPALAIGLLGRGVPSSRLLTSAENGETRLRFSFLLLDGDDSAPFARLMPEATR